MKLATLLLSHFITITILFAQAPLKETQSDNSTAQFPASSAVANTNLTYKIIGAPNNTFCYDVFAEGRLMIHQSSAPGLPGNEGFKTKEVAV
ncbi:MAG: hypothetical protein KBF32_01605 [Chitinophagales bacterium]|nr:hypothetical protein [Chitinophagales bacterium]